MVITMNELAEKTAVKKYEGIRLSPSSILTYLRCPQEFYYNYVLRLSQPPSIHLIKGSIVHKVLEKFFANKFVEDLEKQMETLFTTEWDNNKEKLDELNLSKDELEKELRDCVNIIDMFLRGFRIKMDALKWIGKAENSRHAFFLLRPKFREKFYVDDELNLCGYIDRIHTDFSGITTIGDYKTSNRYGIGIKDEYEIQCGLYALLHKRVTGKLPDYTSVIFLRFGEEVRTRVTPDQIKNVLRILKEVTEKTKSDNMDDYPKNEGKFCKYCSFFDKCSSLEKIEDDIRIKKAIKKIKGDKDE